MDMMVKTSNSPFLSEMIVIRTLCVNAKTPSSRLPLYNIYARKEDAKWKYLWFHLNMNGLEFRGEQGTMSLGKKRQIYPALCQWHGFFVVRLRVLVSLSGEIATKQALLI